MKTKKIEYLNKYGNNPLELRVALGEYLRALGVTPNRRYTAILEYLLKHDIHPTADDVFLALTQSMPDLSRSYTCTALDIMERVGAINMVQSASGEFYYDAHTVMPHAHSICKCCGKVRDISLKSDPVELLESTEDVETDEIEIITTGLCHDCEMIEEDA